MTDRPNILLIITDQHRADHLACYGNDIVRTPNIDALAARGTRFSRFYVSCPICMPNRATLMTGRVPSLHGVRQNGQPLSLQATTFTELLRNAGYATALVGKSHLQNISDKEITMGLREPDPAKIPPPEGLEEARRDLWADGRYDQELPGTWLGEQGFELSLPFYGFEHVSLAIGHGDGVEGHYSRWLAARHDDPDSLRGPENAQDPGRDIWAPQAWRTSIPEELYPTTYITEETIGFLERHAAEKKDQPFFLECSIPDPHHPFTPPGRYFDMYAQEDIPAPPAWHHPKDKLPPHVAAMHADRDEGRPPIGEHTVFACTEQQARGAIALNYGSITMIDDCIGRILGRLDELGLADNTIVVFTSDHGDFMGDHQLILKGALHYRGLVNVPCIWADPRATQRDMVCDTLCGTIDLPTSFLDAAGVAPFNGMQGKSLPDIAQGRDGRDGVVIEEDQRRTYMGMPPNFRVRTLITDRHRLTVYSCADWGELYDLDADPHEFENLWDDPGSASLKAGLMEQLARELMDLADPSPLCTGHGP